MNTVNFCYVILQYHDQMAKYKKSGIVTLFDTQSKPSLNWVIL